MPEYQYTVINYNDYWITVKATDDGPVVKIVVVNPNKEKLRVLVHQYFDDFSEFSIDINEIFKARTNSKKIVGVYDVER